MRVPSIVLGLVAAAIVFLLVYVLTDGSGSRSASPRVVAPGRSANTARPPAGSLDGRAVFAKLGCGSCHHLTAAGTQGQIGPDLDTRLRQHTRASLIARITASQAPESFGAMPSFAGRIKPGELEALVRYLLQARQPR